MPDLLTQLSRELLEYTRPGDMHFKSSLGCLGIYHCCKLQELRSIPILQPMMVLVISGYKEVSAPNQQLRIEPGDLLLLPADTTIWMSNYPSAPQSGYQSLALGFGLEALRHFRQAYSAQLPQWNTTQHWQGKAPENVVALLQQWLHWCRHYTVNPQLLQHRQVELLLMLAQAGLAGNLLLGEQPSWRRRVAQLLAQDPAHDWQIQNICDRLNLSESSLRRRLQDEQSSFREILEEVRLLTGLTLLQETYLPIGHVADAVGYQSQSRFGERFKRRFGMTPSELRRTRGTDTGESLTKKEKHPSAARNIPFG